MSGIWRAGFGGEICMGVFVWAVFVWADSTPCYGQGSGKRPQKC